ncbi:hypothetical protein [Microbulbifer sp. S227A]|uniref:hypothetical protein n=1 Tax=Microbulbifer sp. S227A TaxID=3415131 RepID=UPI003C7C3E1F
MTVYHGYLYRWGTETSPAPKSGVQSKWDEQFREAGNFEFVAEYSTGRNRNSWKSYTYFSPEPLSRFHRFQKMELNHTGPFPYEVLVRVNELTGTVVLLSTGSGIVYHLVDKVLNHSLSPRLVRLQVNILDLTNHLLGEGVDQYALTSVRARIVASGRNLEKISFEGKDLANASIVRQLVGLMTPHYVGMRSRKDPVETEAIRLSNRGYIAISFGESEEDRFEDSTAVQVPSRSNEPPEKHVSRAENCLHYISENGFFWS